MSSFGFRQAAGADVGRRLAVHAAALVESPGVVRDQVGVEVGLHLGDALVELGPAQDAEVLIEQCPVHALDEAVGPGSADLGGAVLDVRELEEQLVGMTVGAAAEPLSLNTVEI